MTAMRTFLSWSRWFERPIIEGWGTPNAFAIMGWVAAHASSDGTGFSFDTALRKQSAKEVGMSEAEFVEAIELLKQRGMIAENCSHVVGTVVMCVVFEKP